MIKSIKEPIDQCRQHLPGTRHRSSMSGRDEWLLLSAVLKELLAGHALAHPDPGACMTERMMVLLVGTVDVVSRTANEQ